jgi:hypothetical protein
MITQDSYNPHGLLRFRHPGLILWQYLSHYPFLCKKLLIQGIENY